MRSNAFLSILALVFWAAIPAGGAWGDTAEKNYRLYCAQCHGINGNGRGINETAGTMSVSPRDHTNGAEMSKLSDTELKLAIVEGGQAVQKSDLMPAWGKTLSESEIDDMVAYLRKLCRCEAKK